MPLRTLVWIWYLPVARAAAEVVSQNRQDAWETGSVAGLAVLCAMAGLGIGLGLYWRERRLRPGSMDLARKEPDIASLRESEARFRGLFEHARDAQLVLKSPSWRFASANPACARMFGVSDEKAMLAHTPWELSPERQPNGRFSADMASEVIAKALQDGFHCFDWTHRRVNGEEFFTEVLLVRLDHLGEQSLHATVRDVTDRRRAEELALRWQRVFETADFMLAHTDARTNTFIEVNAASARAWGYDRSELIGKPITTIYPPEALAALRERFQTANASGHLVFESLHRRKDGSCFPVMVDVTTIRDAEGRAVSRVAYAQDITERKRSETDLLDAHKEQERMLLFREALLAAVPTPVFYKDREGRYLGCNRCFTEMMGFSSEELRGKTVYEVWPDENARQYHSKDMELLANPGPQSYEFSMPDKTGAERQVIFSKNVFHDESNRPAGIIGVFLDITDRKRDEARSARDRLRTEFLLELHQRAPQLADGDLYNHVLERAVQLTSSEVGFFHQVSEDQSTIILTTWNRRALENCSVGCDTHYPLKEAGNWVECVRHQKPVVYNDYEHSPQQRGLPEGHAPLRRFMSIPVVRDGKVRIIFGVGNKAESYDHSDVEQLQIVANELHKIMMQRDAQNQLRQSEQRFRHLVETTLDWVWEVDASCRYTYASPKIQHLLGYHPEEVIGRTPFDFKPRAEAQRVEALLRDLFEANESFAAVLNTSLHKDGREVILESSGVPVFDEQGILLGYRGIDRDVTERRRLESHFRQAQKLEAVGQLAGGVAHDFNNILASILMQYSLLEMNPYLDGAARDGLHEIAEEARRAASLTRQLLLFSRQAVLDFKPLHLDEVVGGLMKMLRRLIGEHITLDHRNEASLPLIDADAGMIEQVIMNLVVNSRDAMPKGGTITIATTFTNLPEPRNDTAPDRRGGSFVVLAVSDTGCGMDPETLKRIFDPFFTTKAIGKGTGLGLSTVHGIVAQHGGWVDVESKVGDGTTFRVYLPATQTAPEGPGGDALKPLVQGGTETVLVVEDQGRIKELLATILQAHGYCVLTAASGPEALALWPTKGATVDLLLTDMIMPGGMTGLELTERLRALRPGLKAIISSGYSAETAQRSAIDQAGILYLPKPYEADALAEAVRKCLDQQAAG